MEVTILAVSARAQAQSAQRAGYRVRVIDYFGDEDTRRLGPVRSLAGEGKPYSAEGLLELALAAPDPGLLTYGANLENRPDLIEVLDQKYQVLGNPVAVLRQVRHPLRVGQMLQGAGFPAPAVWLPEAGRPLPEKGGWLVKPLAGGGGHGIRPYAGEVPPEGHYLQQEIQGTAGSASFLADGRRARLLGLSRQLSGRRGFGSQGYLYTGNLYPLCQPEGEGLRLWQIGARIAQVLTAGFELRGWNGFDFVANGEGLWVTEVNPRYSASLELVERALGIPLFAWHVEACGGRLPAGETPWLGPPRWTWAKGVVYAESHWQLPATDRWPGQGRADIPRGGGRVEKGQPVCTVFAEGSSPRAAYRRLVRAAEATRKECMACSSRLH